MKFSQYLEVLKPDFPYNLRNKTTFGIEVEFAIPLANEEEEENRNSGSYSEDEIEATEDAIDKVQDVIIKSGYRTGLGDASSYRFGVGTDGRDTEYQRPVIELRSPPIQANQQEFEKLENFLTELKEMINASNYILQSNTGIHVHVSNDKLKNDIFDKLSAVLHVDEQDLWNNMAAPLDRDMTRHSLMNRQEDFERPRGVQTQIINAFKEFQGEQPKVYTADGIRAVLKGIGRNIAVNFNTEQPTVEYRYLSSAILNKEDGVKETMRYIKYFVNHADSRTSKNQFRIGTEYSGYCTFTRLEGNRIRVDCHKSKKSIPQTPTPNKSIRTNTPNRPPDLGMQQWKKEDPNSFKKYLNHHSSDFGNKNS